MSNKVWNDLNLDFYELFEGQQYESLIHTIDENRKAIIHKWIENDYEELEKTLWYGSSLLNFFISSIEDDSKYISLVKIGSLLGTIESIERLLYEKGQEKLHQLNTEFEGVRIKHLPEVVRALELNGSMTHNELCEFLKVKTTTLTEAMKKILQTEYVQAIHSGKYKLYSLTDMGIRYGRRIREWKKELQDGNEVRNMLDALARITDEYTKSHIYDLLMEFLEANGKHDMVHTNRFEGEIEDDKIIVVDTAMSTSNVRGKYSNEKEQSFITNEKQWNNRSSQVLFMDSVPRIEWSIANND